MPLTVSFGDQIGLSISVGPGAQIAVDAPAGESLQSVWLFVEDRRNWISELIEGQGSASASRPGLTLDIRDGGSAPYMGRRLRLSVSGNNPAGAKARLSGATLELRLPGAVTRKRTLTLLGEWYFGRAAVLLPQRVATLFCQQRKLLPGNECPTVRVRSMQTRWGSCNSTGGLCLNSELVRCALPLIDYVIVHELCHLIELNHSPRFYSLLSRAMPDWSKRKALLDAYLV